MFRIPIRVIISIFRARLVFAGELGEIGFATLFFLYLFILFFVLFFVLTKYAEKTVTLDLI